MNSLNESNCCRTRPFSSKKDEMTVQASSCLLLLIRCGVRTRCASRVSTSICSKTKKRKRVLRIRKPASTESAPLEIVSPIANFCGSIRRRERKRYEEMRGKKTGALLAVVSADECGFLFRLGARNARACAADSHHHFRVAPLRSAQISPTSHKRNSKKVY